MLYNFSNQTIVVTGGEQGIGRATAKLLAAAGGSVFVGDVTLRPENDAEYQRLGITRLTCDVRQETAIQSLIGTAFGQTGRLQVLVNNAGVGHVGPITEVSEAEWDHVMGVNLKGAFLGCKHAIPLMKAAGGGAIVNTASNAGLLPRVHDPLYSISKQAIVGLTRSLALCHAIDGIRVNAVCPGPVEQTGMMDENLAAEPDPQAAYLKYVEASPLAAAARRMIRPQEVAEAIAYLASEAAAMVTGTCLAIDGGKSLGVPPRRNF